MKHPSSSFPLLLLSLAVMLCQHVEAQTATYIPLRSQWKYLDNGSNQGTAWRGAGFNDGAWTQGVAQLGYGDGDEATVVSFGPNSSAKYITTYFRRAFDVADAAAVTGLTLKLLRDDGAVVYLNGTEVFRNNLPSGTVISSTLAPVAIGGTDESALIEAAISPVPLLNGPNVLAVEMHQQSGTSSDISFDLELTGDVPPGTISLLAPANGQTGVGVPAILRASVTDNSGDPLTVTFYGRQSPSVVPGPNFTVAVLPDTQFYSSSLNGGTPAMFKAQSDWIIANREQRNIVYVAHVGDIVQNGDTFQQEWLYATDAMYDLEDPIRTSLTYGIPYGAAVGNHDSTPIGDADGTTNFYNQYFGEAHFSGKPYYAGHYGLNNDNKYELFSASGLDFIVIYLEYDTTPSAAVLTWANDLLAAHPNRHGIVVSHYLVGTGNPAAFGAQGQATYNALRGNSNLFMMLCGHVDGEGQRTDVYNGNSVHTILSDYQGRINGGNGWMRIMEFSPANNTVQIKTYSPVLNQWETDLNSEFSLDLNLEPAGLPFVAIQTNIAVASGATTSATWTGLTGNTSYQWHATSNDGTTSIVSEMRSFTTASGAPPVADNQEVITPEDTSVAITLTATDADGDPLTYAIVSGPARGSLAGAPPNLAYFPAADYYGTDSFSFKANDGLNDSAVATVSLTITAVNDQAAGNPQAVTLPENSSRAIILTATDPDGDTLSYRIATAPLHGILTGSAPNVTYTPAPDYTGSDSFTFVVHDGTLDSEPASVSINIQPVNRAPVASPQSVATTEDQSVVITLTATDAEGDPLTYGIAAGPTQGTLSSLGPNLTYTPNPNYAGADGFTFTASDGISTSAPAAVSISVASVNDAPVALAQSVTVENATPVTVTLAGSDVDGDALTYTIVDDPLHGTLSGTPPSVTYAAAADYSGPDNFTFTATDVNGVTSAPAEVTIQVTEPFPWKVIALTGSAAPGVSGGTFTTLFADYASDASGRAVFRGTANSGGSSYTGIWEEESSGLRLVALQGGPAPDIAGALFGTFTAGAWSAGTGDLLIYGKMVVGSGGVNSSSDAGYWLRDSSGPLRLVARENSAAPGLPAGAKFGVLNSTAALVTGGRYAFTASLITNSSLGISSANDTGLWAAFAGSPALIAREGSAAPDTATGQQFESFTAFAVTANQAGRIGFRGSLKGTGVTSSNRYGIWQWDPTQFRILVRGAQTAAGTASGTQFLQPQNPSMADAALSFSATLRQGTGDANQNTDSGLWISENGTMALVAREGAQAPGVANGSVFAQVSEGAVVNDAGELVFRASLRTGGSVTTSNDAGIWASTEVTAGVPALVAREGRPAPGTPAGSVFSSFDVPLISPDGREAFTAALLLGSGGVTASTDRGLWVRNSLGELTLALREGDLLEFAPGDSRTVSGITLSGFPTAGRTAWDNQNHLLVLVTFTDGKSALLRYTLP